MSKDKQEDEVVEIESWDELTVPELQKECEARGLTKSGNKPDLVARLDEYDADQERLERQKQNAEDLEQTIDDEDQDGKIIIDDEDDDEGQDNSGNAQTLTGNQNDPAPPAQTQTSSDPNMPQPDPDAPPPLETEWVHDEFEMEEPNKPGETGFSLIEVTQEFRQRLRAQNKRMVGTPEHVSTEDDIVTLRVRAAPRG